MWNGLRVQYIFEKDFKKRQEIENMIDFLISKHVPGLKSEHILLPPPEKEQACRRLSDRRGDLPG